MVRVYIRAGKRNKGDQVHEWMVHSLPSGRTDLYRSNASLDDRQSCTEKQ